MSERKTPAKKKLPSRPQLPSGRIVALRMTESPAQPLHRAPGAALFEEVLAAEAAGFVVLMDGSVKVPCESLALGDFHAVRALLTAGGVLHESPVTIHCKNCDGEISVEPCNELPLGPFRDAELDDPELDATLPFGEKHPIVPLSLGRARVASTVTFEARTAAECRPLFIALAQKELTIDRHFVRGMGIVRLGPETDVDRIANALAAAEEDAFGSLTNRFLESHYPLRLGAIIRCDTCGARNDVDAPFERELDVAPESETKGQADASLPSSFPTFDEIAAMAHAAFLRHCRPFGEDAIDLVVDDEVPACDDGGEPLLGSYVPGVHGTDTEGAIGARATVTLYVRTFRAMWSEEGPYDVEREIDETIEHEIEHHGHFLSGHDPMDDEERALIAEEAERVVGKKELARVATRNLSRDIGEFMRRTWLLWVVLLVALLFALLRNSQ